MAKILVLGGTGFIGIPIVEHLLEQGHRVTILTRGQANPFLRHPVERLRGDRTDSESLRKAVGQRSFDVVVDNLAYVKEDVLSAVDIFGGRVEQYILTSSVVVYGSDFKNPVREESISLSQPPAGAKSPVPGKSTGSGKRQCELALWQAHEGKPPFYFTILRPAKIHGPRDPSPRLWWYIQRIADGGPLVIPDDSPDPLIRHVYSGDLAKAYTGVLLNRRCYNQTYNVAGDEIISLHSLMCVIAGTLGRELRVIKAPRSVMEQAGLLETSNPLAALGDPIPDITKAKEDFAWRSSSTADWIKSLAHWYLGERLVADSWGYSRRKDELTLASRFDR